MEDDNEEVKDADEEVENDDEAMEDVEVEEEAGTEVWWIIQDGRRRCGGVG